MIIGSLEQYLEGIFCCLCQNFSPRLKYHSFVFTPTAFVRNLISATGWLPSNSNPFLWLQTVLWGVHRMDAAAGVHPAHTQRCISCEVQFWGLKLASWPLLSQHHPLSLHLSVIYRKWGKAGAKDNLCHAHTSWQWTHMILSGQGGAALCNWSQIKVISYPTRKGAVPCHCLQAEKLGQQGTAELKRQL